MGKQIWIRLVVLAFGVCWMGGCAFEARPQRPLRTKMSLAVDEGDLEWKRVDGVFTQRADYAPNRDPIPEAGNLSLSGLDIGTSESPARIGLFLGVGEAPYDDGLPPNDLQFKEVSGFSDSVIHVSYEASLLDRVSWFSQVSAYRLQSQTLLEALEEGRIAWVTLGLRWSF